MFDKKTLDEMVKLQLKIKEIFDKSDYGFLGVSEKNVQIGGQEFKDSFKGQDWKKTLISETPYGTWYKYEIEYKGVEFMSLNIERKDN